MVLTFLIGWAFNVYDYKRRKGLRLEATDPFGL